VYVTACDLEKSFTVDNKSFPVIWEEPRRHPSRQKMDSRVLAVQCSVLTADESNH